MQIPVTYNREQQPVRLLELPPDLLELIDGGAGPEACLRLAFKSVETNASGPSDASNPASSGPAAHVVLTSASKTYLLRQVQTSNSLLLLQTKEDGSLEITSTCTSALELEDLPVPAVSDPAALKTAPQHLTGQLPVYTSPEDLDVGGPSKEAIFAHIPYSETELEAAWVQLAAFSSPAGASFRPSASTLLELWSGTLAGATLAGIDLASGQGVLAQELWQSVDTPHPRELFVAMLCRISSRWLDADRQDAGSRDAAWLVLDAERCVPWVCSLVERSASLQAKPSLGETSLEAWAERCRAHVPEVWRDLVSTHILQAKEDNSSGSASEAVPSDAASAGTVKPGEKPEAGRAVGQRNWHERFKRMRR